MLFKKKTKLLYPIKFILNFEQMNVFKKNICISELQLNLHYTSFLKRKIEGDNRLQIPSSTFCTDKVQEFFATIQGHLVSMTCSNPWNGPTGLGLGFFTFSENKLILQG